MARTLQDATNALHQGNKNLAVGILATMVKSEPNNETAWLMLASMLNDNEKKRHCLQRVLAINPGNSQAALELLRLQQPVVPPSPAPRIAPKSSSIESVQCPKCGAPVDVTPGSEFLHCTYCGAGLRITRGASGHAMATLDDIKVDTSILASDTALKHLDERLRAKEASLSQLEATRTAHLRELQDLKLPDGRGRGGVGTKEFGMVLIVSSLILMVPGFALQIGQRTSRADALVLLLAGVGMLLLGVGLLAKAKSEAYSETRIRAERTTVITERSRDLTERIRSLEVQMADAAKEVEDIKSQKKALKSQIDTLTGQL